MNFLRHLIIEGTKRWGGFMAIGGHISMTQTNWHWLIETLMVLTIDSLFVLGLYLEWKDGRTDK